MNPRVFELPPPGKLATLLPLLIGGVLPLVMLGVVLGAGIAGTQWLPVLAAILVMPVVAWAVAASIRGRTVELLPDGLRVRRWPVAKQSPLAEFDLSAARVADLDAEPGLRPTFKLAGTYLPGFRSGWFWLRDRRRAYVLLTTARKVLLLPRRDGAVWLLGVQRPEALLAALRPHG